MNKLYIAAAALMFAAAPAFADDDATDEEAAKLKAAVEQWGCEGGTYQKEGEGTGVFQADDVKCPAGQYDFRMTKDFKVFAIIMD